MESRRFSSVTQLLDIEANKVVLKNGATGSGVGNIQIFLLLIGNRLPRSIRQGRPDGIFGPETESLVKKFQGEAGLKADGIVGRKTIAAMDRVLVAKPFLDKANPNSYGAAVMAGAGRRLQDRPVYFD